MPSTKAMSSKFRPEMTSIRLRWKDRTVKLDYQFRDGWSWYWAAPSTPMTDAENEEFVEMMEGTRLWEYMQEVLNGRL